MVVFESAIRTKIRIYLLDIIDTSILSNDNYGFAELFNG